MAPDHPDAFLAAIDEELARRSCEDKVVIFEDLPPIKPSEITQILREIDGKTKGTPSAPSTHFQRIGENELDEVSK